MIDKKIEKLILSLLVLFFSVCAVAQVKISVDDQQKLNATWKGKTIIKQSIPHLSQTELLNKDFKPVELGKQDKWQVKKSSLGIVFKKTYLPSGLTYSFNYYPVSKNALGIKVELKCPEPTPDLNKAAFIEDFKVQFVSLVMPGAKRIQILYPAGKYGYSPVGIMQGKEYELGIALLKLHRQDRLLFTNVSGFPSSGNKLNLKMTTDWGQHRLLKGKMARKYSRTIRLTFGPVKSGEANLKTRPELWKCYLDEVTEWHKSIPPPKYDPKRPVMMAGFSTQFRWITPENPVGYEYYHIKPDSKYWQKRGYDQGGPPENWIENLANEHIRKMKEINAQGIILWKTAINPLGGNLNYIAEAQDFHPQLEKRELVNDQVSRWDTVVADVKLFDEKDQLLAEKKGMELRVDKLKHRLEFGKDDLTKVGQALADKNSWIKENWRLRKAGIALPVYVADALPALKNSKVGQKFTLPAMITRYEFRVKSEQSGKWKLKLKGTIKKIERTLINIYVKKLHDAGYESGFINRGDITAGVPWKQKDLRMDFSSEWQYQVFADRFKTFRDRFGPMCRWFYIDSLGGKCPADVMRRLRNDFPNLIMAPEHEYDLTHRILGISYAAAAPDEKQMIVAPDSLLLVNTVHLKTEEIAKTIINNPHVIPLIQPHVSKLYLEAKKMVEKKKSR